MIRTLHDTPVRVRSAHSDRLFALLQRHGFRVRRVDWDELWVDNSCPAEVARLATFFQVPLLDLGPSSSPPGR